MIKIEMYGYIYDATHFDNIICFQVLYKFNSKNTTDQSWNLISANVNYSRTEGVFGLITHTGFARWSAIITCSQSYVIQSLKFFCRKYITWIFFLQMKYNCPIKTLKEFHTLIYIDITCSMIDLIKLFIDLFQLLM